MTKKVMTGIVVCCMAVGIVQADTYRYRQSGDWSTVTDGASEGWGVNPNNSGAPGAGLPGASDEARINWGGNTVTVTTSTPAVNKVQIGVDESGNVIVESGGVLNGNRVYAGHNNVNATGTLTVKSGGAVEVSDILYAANNSSTGFIDINSGGVVNVGSHLWLGATGAATINISGTLTQTGGILGLGTSNASTAGGGTAMVNVLDGGLLTLNNIHGGGTSIMPGSIIDLADSGRIEMAGDFRGHFNNTYIPGGFISGDGVVGDAIATYDANADLTTVVAIPEAATFGLIAIFGGAIIFVRRMKQY